MSWSIRLTTMTAILLYSTLVPADSVPVKSMMQLDESAIKTDTLKQQVAELRKQGNVVQAVEALAERLSDDDPRVRRRSAVCLSEFETDASLVLEQLVNALDDEYPDVAEAAARALGRIGKAARDAGPVLVRVLESELELSRIEAAIALGKIGCDLDKAIPVLTKSLNRPDMRAKLEIIRTLERLGPKAGSATEPLIKCLDSQSPAIRWAAIDALAAIGAEEAIPKLKSLVENTESRGESGWAWIAAVKALGRLGDRDVAAFLVDVAEREHGRSRYAAIKAMGELGIQAADAEASLQTFLADEHEYNRNAAGEALERISAPGSATTYGTLLGQASLLSSHIDAIKEA